MFHLMLCTNQIQRLKRREVLQLKIKTRKISALNILRSSRLIPVVFVSHTCAGPSFVTSDYFYTNLLNNAL